MRDYNGYVVFDEDITYTDDGEVFLIKGKHYPVECIGRIDMAVHIVIVDEGGYIQEYILWGRELDEFLDKADWIHEDLDGNVLSEREYYSKMIGEE
jgi:hypothetical protein